MEVSVEVACWFAATDHSGGESGFTETSLSSIEVSVAAVC